MNTSFPEKPDPEKIMAAARPKDEADDLAAPKFLAIARITRPQGRRGEVAAEILTGFPDRFQSLEEVYLLTGSKGLRTRSTMPEKKQLGRFNGR